MMRTGTLALFVLLMVASPAATQPGPVGPSRPLATLRGVLVDAENGAALPRARVDVTSAGKPLGMVMSDERGAFIVTVPGERVLSIAVIKAGYAVIRRDVTSELLRGIAPLQIQVPRGGAIVGRMIDTAGEPATSPTVRVRRLPGGDASAAGELLTTRPDERGEFRIGGLPAGRYVIEGNATLTSSSPRPVTVDLAPGIEVTGVDLVVPRREFDVMPDRRNPSGVGSTIRGTVSTTRGAPVVDATVTVRRQSRMWDATTDLRGQFTIPGVSPGTVTLSATKRGYIPSAYGQRGADLPGQTISVEADRDVDRVSIVMPRTSVVTGMVVDEQGDPLQDARVYLLRVRRSPSGLVAIREAGTFAERTDDRGHFRLFQIMPGDYIATASLPAETVEPSVGPRSAYVPAYYPDTHDLAGAAPVRIGSEEDVSGILITMRRVPVVRVTGRVIGPDGEPFIGAVRLVPRSPGLVAPDVRIVNTETSGEFVFADLPRGDYLVQVMASGPSGTHFASVPITVADDDPAPLLMRTSPGSTLSGQLVLDGSVGELLWGYSFSSIPVDVAVSASARSTQGGPMGTGEPFSFNGLMGPTRLRVWSDDANWYLRSILINGVEAADAPFDFGFDGRAYTDVDFVFSRSGASISGRATDARATPVRDYAVYVFPGDRDKWTPGSRWIRLVRASAEGTFKAAALPPGDYWVAAVDRAEAAPGAADWVDPWVDPELLDMLVPSATRVFVGAGETRALDLRLINR
jgi:hypothetical protein